MKACDFIIKLRGPNVLFLDTYELEVVTSQLYVVFSVLPVLGKLICSREFEFLILVVCVSNSKNNKTWLILVLHVMWCLAHRTFSSTILK